MESVIKETAISMQGISKYYKYYEKEIDRAKKSKRSKKPV